MFSLFGPEVSIKNVYLLGHKHMAGRPVSHTAELRGFYLDFLAEHQPDMPVNRAADPFVGEDVVENRLKESYRASSLNDLKQEQIIGDAFEPAAREALIGRVREGYQHLAGCSAELQAVFDLAIHSVFFRKSTRTDTGAISFGGSSSTAMGAIWVSGHGALSKFDVAEFLVHELTHHLLFISERCKAQFHYKEMIKPENYAQSAILDKRRPLDKVVHSIAVSTELLLARRRFLAPGPVVVHPGSEALTARTLRSIDEVLRMPSVDKVVTPWTIELLERCQDAIKPVEALS